MDVAREKQIQSLCPKITPRQVELVELVNDK